MGGGGGKIWSIGNVAPIIILKMWVYYVRGNIYIYFFFWGGGAYQFKIILNFCSHFLLLLDELSTL